MSMILKEKRRFNFFIFFIFLPFTVFFMDHGKWTMDMQVWETLGILRQIVIIASFEHPRLITSKGSGCPHLTTPGPRLSAHLSRSSRIIYLWRWTPRPSSSYTTSSAATSRRRSESCRLRPPAPRSRLIPRQVFMSPWHSELDSSLP
jgi:hypothetical protein